MNRDSAALGVALLAVMLGGCGGGGGSAAPAPPPGPTATGTINSGSVLSVTGRSIDAVIRSGSFGDITNVVGLTTIAAGEPANFGGQAAGRASVVLAFDVPSLSDCQERLEKLGYTGRDEDE